MTTGEMTTGEMTTGEMTTGGFPSGGIAIRMELFCSGVDIGKIWLGR